MPSKLQLLRRSKSLPGDRALSQAVSRRTDSIVTPRHRRRLQVLFVMLIVVSIVATLGVLFWGNPTEFMSDPWKTIAKMRGEDLVVIAVVALCQSFATVSFQTATQNRIITPSIMGFESLYRLIQTASVFFLGISGVMVLDNTPVFFLQVGVMVLLSVMLYTWLLSGKLGNLHVMLLVGIIIGGGLGSLSTFMQRLMDPNEFDVLTARLFGNISNSDTSNLLYTIPIVLVVCGIIYARSNKLNLMSLGRDATTNLGLNHRRELIVTLFLVSVLMAMTTALVGPMTFLGFLVATLAYSFTDTYDHRYIFPASFLIGYSVLASAYFVLRHVFYAGGVVTIVVELVGGIAFLVVVMRKGRL